MDRAPQPPRGAAHLMPGSRLFASSHQRTVSRGTNLPCALTSSTSVTAQCVVLTAPNGRRMMLDCGDRWGDGRFWTRSLHFFRETIDLLGLMNLDEDHLSDFKNVMQDCTVPWILSNPTVGPREF